MTARQKKAAPHGRDAERAIQGDKRDGKKISCHNEHGYTSKGVALPRYILSQKSVDVKMNDKPVDALDDLDDEIMDVIKTFDRLAKKAMDACEKSLEADAEAETDGTV